MSDVRLMELAARQHRCVARRQLLALGYSQRGIEHRLAGGRLVAVFDGVYAVAPLGDERRTLWMAATLTAPGTVLSHASAGAAFAFRPFNAPFETVTRPGSGGPERKDGVLILRTRVIEATTLDGIPITTPERTLVDLAPHLDDRRLARAVREAIRVTTATPSTILKAMRRRRGAARLRLAVARYAGLPAQRARSNAELLALAILTERGMPAELNRRIAGEEADLSWPAHRLILELDGPQFHLDATEDLRKQEIWEAAGWTVRRLATGDVYLDADRLTAAALP
jgi:predicted transcriptional regulator of viral defense system